jgi:hypothetical protein
MCDLARVVTNASGTPNYKTKYNAIFIVFKDIDKHKSRYPDRHSQERH